VESLRRQSQVGSFTCEKSGFELIEFEEMVKIEGGCWLRFIKVPVQNAGATGAKGAPPKGKPGATTEDPKPIVGKAWVSL